MTLPNALCTADWVAYIKPCDTHYMVYLAGQHAFNLPAGTNQVTAIARCDAWLKQYEID